MACIEHCKVFKIDNRNVVQQISLNLAASSQIASPAKRDLDNRNKVAQALYGRLLHQVFSNYGLTIRNKMMSHGLLHPSVYLQDMDLVSLGYQISGVVLAGQVLTNPSY